MSAVRVSPRKRQPTERQLQLDRPTKTVQRQPRRCKQCPPPHPLQTECTVHYKRAPRRQPTEGPNLPAMNQSRLSPEVEQSSLPTCGLSLDTGNLLGPSAQERVNRAEPPSPTPVTNHILDQPLFGGFSVLDDTQRPQTQLNGSEIVPDIGHSILNDPATLPAPFGSTQDDHNYSPFPPGAMLSADPGGILQTPTRQSGVGQPPSPLVPDSGSSRPPSPSPSASTPTPVRRNRVARTFINGKRQRATNANPHFGFMLAKKGTGIHKIVRSGSLVGPLPRHQINRRFTRATDRILLNCEKVSNETGCWLYIAAHHPSVQGEHVSWMSPAMRDELPPNAQNRLNNTASGLFSALKLARRQNVAEVELEAAKARAERDAAQKALAEHQSVIDKLAFTLRSQGMDVASILAPIANGSGS
ncbi:hypothetical protein AAF712_013775 [Marasmius tenuissimus]|uniref:Uncharacterized protein n=1 Tax=Marasmius tenuissimus TaxID=585030 RepID=A0ABR2ZDZ8_9AGAR|nr:hypothetical protein PM082_013794 [Marasmius tenuissimus]